MKIQEFDVIRAIETIQRGNIVVPKGTEATVVDLTMFKGKPRYIIEFSLKGHEDPQFAGFYPSNASGFALIARERARFDPPMRFSGDAASLKRDLEATSGAPSAVALKKPKYSNKPKNRALNALACGRQQVAIYACSYGDSVPTTCGEVPNDGG